MKTEKIFKAEDGSRYQVVVEVSDSSITRPRYDVDVYVCAPRKRTFVDVSPRYRDDWKWRQMSIEQQHQLRIKEIKNAVPKEWIEQVLTQLLDEIRTKFEEKWLK